METSTEYNNESSTITLMPNYGETVCFLDDDKTCWLKVYKDRNLEEINFYKLYAEREGGSTDIINNTDSNFSANRIYKTYGTIPRFEADKYTYMYGDLEKRDKCYATEDNPFVEKIVKHFDYKYNNAIVNWYESGDNYIPFHKDCEKQMTTSKEIAIVSFTPELYSEYDMRTDVRTLVFKCDNTTSKMNNKIMKYKQVNVKATNGSVVVMGGDTNTYYRHGVQRHITSQPRISISMRTIMEMEH